MAQHPLILVDGNQPIVGGQPYLRICKWRPTTSMTSMWRHHVNWTPICAWNVAKNAFHKYSLTDYLTPRSWYTGAISYILYPISCILYPISFLLYWSYLSFLRNISVSWWTSIPVTSTPGPWNPDLDSEHETPDMKLRTPSKYHLGPENQCPDGKISI